MTAIYESGNIPFVSGSLLNAKYLFKAIRFLCGNKIKTQTINQHNTINGQLFDVEMQLLAETETDNIPTKYLHSRTFLIFSHFFIQQSTKNYSIEPLMKCLKYIRRTASLKTIRKSFPLDRIVCPTTNGFYGYLRQYSGYDIHHFIDEKHLIPIGIAQMNEFRKLAYHTECSFNKGVQIENHSFNTMKLMQYFVSEELNEQKHNCKSNI